MKKLSVIVLLLFQIFIFPVNVQSADSTKRIGCGGDLGPIAEFICTVSKGSAGNKAVGDRLNSIFSVVIGFLTIVAALWFAIQFILAGFNWINAGGDKNSATTAFQKMTNAVVGLLIVVAAWVIIGVIGKVLGLDILDPGKVIENLSL